MSLNKNSILGTHVAGHTMITSSTLGGGGGSGSALHDTFVVIIFLSFDMKLLLSVLTKAHVTGPDLKRVNSVIVGKQNNLLWSLKIFKRVGFKSK